MSSATRCPACGTTFRIEPEQLALADGWARCGRCSTVFDAAAERREPADVGMPPASAPASAPASVKAAASSDADAFAAALLSFGGPAPLASVPATSDRGDAAEDPADDGDGTVDADPGRPVDVDAPETGAILATGALSPSAPPIPAAFDPWRELPSLSLGPDPAVASPSPSAAVPTPTPASSPLDPASPVAAPGAMAAEALPATPPASPDMPDTPAPPWSAPPVGAAAAAPGSSGVRPAVRPESVAPAGVIQAASEPLGDADAEGGRSAGGHRHRSWRVVLLVLAIVLLLVLAAQLLYRQRDAVAARHPALRPALASLCHVAGCAIGPLRRPDAIAIEGASFTHAQDGDRYRLAFALRNQADMPLAMPAIELSLLDAQERAVVRRVLLPADFGAAGAALPALSEHAGAVSFALDDGAGADGEPLPRIAGYAMVAFYP